jgi:hypothetical protein
MPNRYNVTKLYQVEADTAEAAPAACNASNLVNFKVDAMPAPKAPAPTPGRVVAAPVAPASSAQGAIPAPAPEGYTGLGGKP